MSLKHIIVGLSGGVDSAVCAHLLKKAGHKVDAIFMKNWEEDDTQEHCAATQDLADAERVCEQLGISLRTVNFSSEYWDYVFEYFLSEHKAGRTPNPDILCNSEIKFKAFLDFATECGAEQIATGHYARVEQHPNSCRLLMATDKNKDQSYFLHGLNQAQLNQSLFPLGGLVKTQVRDIAQEMNLHIHDKKDSTGICFIGETHFRKFLNRFLPLKKGPILDLNGQEIGEHHGAAYYTLGQRKGLGIGGVKNAGEDPWFVVRKDVAKNIIFVAQGADNPALLERKLYTAGVSWISGEAPQFPLNCNAKIRYRQADQVCTVSEYTNSELKVTFRDEQRSITPGQSIVFYSGDLCLGGGVISRT